MLHEKKESPFTKMRPNVLVLALMFAAASIAFSVYAEANEAGALNKAATVIAYATAGLLLTGAVQLARKLDKPKASLNVWVLVAVALSAVAAHLIFVGFGDGHTPVEDVVVAALSGVVGTASALFMAVLAADPDD